ncbi:N-acetylmuramoyl-L-alanine amidase LytC precursor [Oxobacter pfennigii]|uniref:N-acetylmuramoyl-L-alanine amidase LytC n=1 Tax=Oxobacter pfennigii TaxID=36849 RepID=A0A0P8WPI6_9CLOT|nr:cell wall-binding repeat-containing protein [Oxobacter pfennigii]KPU44460.1 N-acetylmuramoyl-L-alanine amidase LytC precursor [Oxobacter pfennigii]
MKSCRWFLNGFILFTFMILTSLIFTQQEAYAFSDATRLAGDNRYSTAASISNSGWEQSDIVVVATGEDFPDALSSAPLAAYYNAPIFLTQKSRLAPETEQELKRLKVKKVYIIGGTGAVSGAVESDISKLTYPGQQNAIEVERIYGPDRAATSVEVAKKLNNFDSVVVATGDDYPDALSIAPIAAKKQIPILLVSRDNISSAVTDFINDKSISKSYVVGGTGVISDAVAGQFSSSERVWGKDRYETNVNIINRFKEDIDFNSMLIATGEDFPDALAGSPFASRHSSSILLTSKTPDDVTVGFVSSLQETTPENSCYVIGGEGVIPQDTLQVLQSREPIVSGKVTLGSTLDEVLDIMGQPIGEGRGQLYELTYYDARIYFTMNTNPYKVIGWDNYRSPKIAMGVKDINASPFTIGSSYVDVVKVMGTPTRLMTENGDMASLREWWYGESTVRFKDGKVTGYNNLGNLKVFVSEADPSAPGIDFESLEGDVLKVMGTPDEGPITTTGNDFDHAFRYGKSTVYFDADGNIIKWENKGDLKMDTSVIDPSAPLLSVGSSKEDVLKKLGYPNEFEGLTWRYDISLINFNAEWKIVRMSNNTSVLKFVPWDKDPKAPPIIIGSDREDVAKAMGQPHVISEKIDYAGLPGEIWEYNYSKISFDHDGRVYNLDDYFSTDMKADLNHPDPSYAAITIGSSEEEVRAAMGEPDYINTPESGYYRPGWTWRYGFSEIYFDEQKKVYGWQNRGQLRVSLGAVEEAAPPFTIGSTLEDIGKVMGTPESIIRELSNTSYYQVSYGNSTIGLDENMRVYSWDNNGRNLKITLGNGSSIPFTIGSSYEDVANALGAPDKMTSDYARLKKYATWEYGNSVVYFNEQKKVEFYKNAGELRVHLGNAEPSAGAIDIGSTRDDVIKAMGTPGTISGGSYYGLNDRLGIYYDIDKWEEIYYDTVWYYGTSWVGMDKNGIVKGWYDGGNLKLNLADPAPSEPPFSVGSTKDEVLKAMGTPYGVDDFGTGTVFWVYTEPGQFVYSWDVVYFNADGKVESYKNPHGHLNVR